MKYDAVVVTRNRPGILALSLPALLQQDPPPEQVIVVDSSDDPGPNQADVAEASRLGPVVHKIGPPGIFRQRKLGFGFTASPVVFFPDDDTLLHPGAARSAMDVYEADKEGRVGAVMFGETHVPPPGLALEAAQTVNHSPLKKLIYRLGSLRADVENILGPSPVRALGERLKGERMADRPFRLDLAPLGARLDRNLQGFRMTFRREAFELCEAAEALVGYSLFEDEVSAMEVLQSFLIASSTKPLAYHHRASGGRLTSYSGGVHMAINQAYLVFRFTPPEASERALLVRSLKVRQWGYQMRGKMEDAREKARGLAAAIPHVASALAIPSGASAQWREEAVRSCLAPAD